MYPRRGGWGRGGGYGRRGGWGGGWGYRQPMMGYRRGGWGFPLFGGWGYRRPYWGFRGGCCGLFTLMFVAFAAFGLLALFLH